MRLLIIEDDRDIREIAATRLRAEGYSVDTCDNGVDGQEFLESAEYDVVILDILLPRRDGITILKHVRKQGNPVPVLLLTAKDTIADRVNGLDAGADDYLIKPFSFAELSARIRVLLRRPQTASPDSILQIADLSMDLNSHLVTRSGKPIMLSQKEYALLEVLMRYKEVVLTREKIEQHIYDFSFEGGSNVVDVYIRYLRKKIDQDHDIKLIHTVRGTGYVLREG